MAEEIEFRGPLSEVEYKKLDEFLKKNGEFTKKWSRKTFVFHTRDKTLDLKVRTTGKASEIVLKKGFWAARKREEIIIPISGRSVDLAKRFLAALGYKDGIITYRITHLFQYQSIEFALVKCPKNYYFYEAEFIKDKSIKNPEKHIQRVLKSLGLKIWSIKESYDFLMFCNREIDKPFSVSFD